MLSRSDALQALELSLWTSSTATVISLLIGVPLAWLLARTTFPGQRLLRALVTLPLVLPPVVGGVALLLAFGRDGFIGGLLNSWFGLTIPFTPVAVVMAETFVAMPFLIVTVEGALRSADLGFEEAAATMGATKTTVFRRVTVPMIAPSLGAGAVLCWARALGEFGATITFAGSFPGQTETMPIAVYYALENDPDAAIALSLVLLLVSVAGAGLAAGPVAAGRLGQMSGLVVDASVTRGGFGLEVTFAVEPGQVVGVLGPNGAGKSTLLKALAGLIPVSAGRISLGGAVLDDARTRQFAEPAGRPVGFVFQDYRLFPHLSVLENVAFSPRARGLGRRAARTAALGLAATAEPGPAGRSEAGRVVRRPGSAGRLGPGPGRLA